MSKPVAVRVRDCPDGSHEEGDVVLLAPTFSLAGGLEAERVNGEALVETLANIGPPPPEGWNDQNSYHHALAMAELVQRKLKPVYVRFGAVGWNFHDADGPVPFDVDAILADYSLALPVVEKADELYAEAVTRPLLNRLARRSQRGRTGQSTSPKASTRQRKGSSSPLNGRAATTRLTA